jgi:hypothetical protein
VVDMKQFQSAISRRLSPLEKTASVAGMKSTYELGSQMPLDAIYEELQSRELDKRSMTQ